jgi:hypothetical protein
MQLHVLVETSGAGLRPLIEQRIESALGPFANRISWVSACLEQVKVSSGSRIHQCHIEAVLTTASVLEVQARAVNTETAVSRAVERVVRRVRAELDSVQTTEQRKHRSPLSSIGS